MNDFENIINALNCHLTENSRPSKTTNFFRIILYISAIFVFTTMLFINTLTSSSEWLKNSVLILLLLSIIIVSGYFLFSFIKFLLSLLRVKNIRSKFNFLFLDELIKAFRVDKEGFFKRVEILKKYDKGTLERFRDWLDYQIKLQGVLVAVFISLIKYLPNLQIGFNSLFEKEGSLYSFNLTNPFEMGIFIISLDGFLLILILIIVSLLSKLPRRLRYLNIVKYTVTHEYSDQVTLSNKRN